MATVYQRPARIGVPALLACCAVGLVLSGCDEKVERTVGDMSARSIEGEYQVVTDPLLADWIDMVGHTLLGYVVRQSIPYSFKVLQTDMVNAFAAPYGHVYVTTGLLDFVESEDEVWGVIGHEIGHVAHRHSLSALKRGLLYDIGLAILGGKSEGLASIAGVGVGLLSLRYSRDNEYEADDMGRVLSFGASYDPRGNADFFQRLQEKYEKKRPSSIEVMFLTHPPSQDRRNRQLAMPELSAGNADALLQTGRGYARRYELKQAEGLLQQAAALRPRDPTTLAALAEVQLARGDYARARESYQTAAGLHASPYTTEGLRLAGSGSLSAPAPPSGQEQATALALVPEAEGAARQAAVTSQRAAARAATVGAAFAPAVTGAHSIITSLFGLTDKAANLSDTMKGVVAYANGAANRAVDPTYSAERQREALVTTAQQMETVTAQVAQQLGDPAHLAAGDVAMLRRTLEESRRALADTENALGELQAAEPAVRAAQESAAQTTQLIGRLMSGARDPGTSQRAQQAAQVTEARALSALAATRKSEALADRAALRALVARMNAAAAATSPQARRNLDGLVAHYTLQRPGQVARLRATGLGYGEVALVLAAARSAQADPSQLARPTAATASMVDQMSAAGTRTDGTLVMLKYLARAMERETR